MGENSLPNGHHLKPDYKVVGRTLHANNVLCTVIEGLIKHHWSQQETMTQ